MSTKSRPIVASLIGGEYAAPIDESLLLAELGDPDVRQWTSAERGGELKSVAYVLRENVEKGEPPHEFFFPGIEPLPCDLSA